MSQIKGKEGKARSMAHTMLSFSKLGGCPDLIWQRRQTSSSACSGWPTQPAVRGGPVWRPGKEWGKTGRTPWVRQEGKSLKKHAQRKDYPLTVWSSAILRDLKLSQEGRLGDVTQDLYWSWKNLIHNIYREWLFHPLLFISAGIPGLSFRERHAPVILSLFPLTGVLLCWKWRSVSLGPAVP